MKTYIANAKNGMTIILFFAFLNLSAQYYFNAPYAESFDTNATPACWTNGGTWMFADINTSGFPSPNAPGIDDHTCNEGFFAWLDASSSNFSSLTSPPVNDSGISSLGLSFWYYMHHPNFSPPKNFLAIDFYDGSSWNNLVDTLSTNSPYWRYYTVDLSSYTITDSVRVRFRGIKGNSSQDILLDDVFIGELPTCIPPQTVLNDTSTATTANLDIIGNPATVWEYEFDTAGFTIGTGTHDTTSNSKLTLQNLQPLTKYEVYVRNICGTGDTSVWYKRSFETTCGIFPAPFSESFDGFVTPQCWTNYALTGNFDYEFSALQDHTGNGGRSALHRRSNDVAMETPLIDLSSLSQPALVFWFQMRNQFITTPSESATHLKVEISQDATVWTPVDSFAVIDFNWQQKILDLSNLGMGDTLAFRFVGESFNNPNGIGGSQIYFDDVSIQESPGCPLPQDSLFFTNITDSSATVNSVLNQAVEIEYGEFTFSRGSGTTQAISGNSLNLSNLQPSTVYTVYFRDSCGSGLSEWSLPFYFKTPCPAQFDIVYKESFNAMPFQSTDFSLECWSSYGTGNTPWISGGSPELSTGPGTRIDGQYAFTEGDSGAPGDISYLESPWVDMSQANFPYMTFHYFMYGSDMGDMCVEVSRDGVQWDTVPNFGCLFGEQQTSDMQPWFLRNIQLNGYSDTIKIRFKAKRGPGKFSDIAIDQIAFFDTCLVFDPVALFTFNLDSLTAAGQYVTFNSTATSTTEYLWDFGDGNSDTGQTVQHIYTSNGSFTVLHRAISACKVADTASDTVNTSGIGISERGLAELGISLFPNPVDEVLNITFPKNFAKADLRLQNAAGKQIFRTETFRRNTEIDVFTLPKGIYFLMGKIEGQPFSAKVLIQ